MTIPIAIRFIKPQSLSQEFMLKRLILMAFLAIFIPINIQAQVCDCKEYFYLNEITNGGVIHKFEIFPDGSTVEIGSPWFSNSASGETITIPHGIASDLNGYLYTGESDNGDIRRLTCDGEVIPASTFEIDVDGIWNMGNIGNIMYANARWNNGQPDGIYAYDLCTGETLGYFCLNGLDGTGWQDWGFHLEPDGTVYVTDSYETPGFPVTSNDLWVFNVNNIPLSDPNASNPPCIDPLISSDDNVVNVGDSELPADDIWGVTTDPQGNIYIVVTDLATTTSTIYKYDSSGVLVAISDTDSTEGQPYPGFSEPNRGFAGARGIVYSETTGLIYVSTESPIDDCVSTFDTDLNYLGAAVSFTNNVSTAKGIGIIKECCPVSDDIVIDSTFCDSEIGEIIFLQDILACEGGVVCEGIWDVEPGIEGLTFNACDLSVTVDASFGCGVFTLSSEGSSTNNQCGGFNVTLNVETLSTPVATVSGDQSICAGEVPSVLTATSPTVGVVYQWQESTMGCAVDYVDVTGATSSTYMPGAISIETYYRVITSQPGTCSSGMCSDTSACITILLDPNCPPPCGAIGGEVYVDINNNGCQDSAETTMVEGATVTLWACDPVTGVPSSTVAMTTTAIDGSYSFDGPDPVTGACLLDPTATYAVEISAPTAVGEAFEGYSLTSGTADATCIAAGESDDVDGTTGVSACYDPADPVADNIDAGITQDCPTNYCFGISITRN